MLEPEEIGGFYCMSVELESAESGYTFLFLSVNSKIGVVFCEKGEYWLGVLCETRNSWSHRVSNSFVHRAVMKLPFLYYFFYIITFSSPCFIELSVFYFSRAYSHTVVQFSDFWTDVWKWWLRGAVFIFLNWVQFLSKLFTPWTPKTRFF